MFNISFAPTAADVHSAATSRLGGGSGGGASAPEDRRRNMGESESVRQAEDVDSSHPCEQLHPLDDAHGGKKKRSRRRRKPGKPRGLKEEPVASPSTVTSRTRSNASGNRSRTSNGNGGKGNRSRRHNTNSSSGSVGSGGGYSASRTPSAGYSAGHATSKKQHDAPMTKRDLYFSLSTQVVQRPAVGPDGAPSMNNMFRVTIVNWDNQTVLDAFVLSDGVSLSPRPPVSACKKSSAPTPMSFTQARNEVERILRGKILIGYDLEQHLKTLRLSHPWSDVRDAATYARLGGSSVSTSPRTLPELSLAVLKRELQVNETGTGTEDNSFGLSDLVPACVTSLDLYKSLRKEWEQDLVHIAKEKEAQQLEQLQEHQQRMASQRQKAMADHYLRLQQQPQELSSSPHMHDMNHHGQFYRPQPFVSQQHMLEVSSQLSSQMSTSQRSRSSSYDGHQQPYAAVLSPHDMIPPMAHQRIPQQHPVQHPHPPQQHPSQQQSKSSWFRRSQKQRAPPVVPQIQTASIANASLSAQAMQALAAPEIHQPVMQRYVGVTSSAYDSSSQFGGSTDFESYYSESMATESVASNDYAASPFPISQKPHEAFADTQVGSQKETTPPSSWFRFGQRKTRFQDQIDHPNGSDSPPLLAVEESLFENRDDGGLLTGASSSDHNQSLSHRSSSKGSFAGIEEQPPSKKEKSWFGFRKSKSPATSKQFVSVDDVDVDESNDNPIEVPPLPFPGALDQNGIYPLVPSSNGIDDNFHPSVGLGGKPPKHSSDRSSWFPFRRSKSPGSAKASRSSVKFSQAELLASSTLPTLSTQVTDADDDWMQEVLNTDSVALSNNESISSELQPVVSVVEAENNANAALIDEADDEAESAESEEKVGEVTTEPDQSSSALSWFTLMRSKSSPGSSRLASASVVAAVDDEAFANDLLDRLTNPTSSFDEKCDDGNVGGRNGWLEGVVAASPIDSACIGSSAWFGYPSVMMEDVPSVAEESADSSKSLQNDHESATTSSNLGLHGKDRSTVLSDDEGVITDIVNGFGESLAFLKE